MKQLVSTHELAGNYTVVIDNCQDTVYLDMLDSQRPGIVMESNMSGNLWMDISEMMSKYKIKTFPNVYAINDSTISSSVPYYTLDSVKYRTRVIRVEDNKLRIFAPLILQTNESIPDIFILYRKDLFCKDSKDEIVDVIDLHRNNISSYITPKNYAYAYINGNNMYINGIDVKDGQFVKADLYSDNILKDESDIEQLIYQSYKDRNMLYNNIINISFVVKDENIFVHNETVDDEFKETDKTSAYLYWGRYANIEEAYPNICIEDYSGLEDDDRSDIFIYTPIMNGATAPHNTIKYVGDDSKVTFLPGNSNNALLKRQDGGYEQVCFYDGISNVKYNTNANNKYKYADVDRTTYSISSYKTMQPSISFQYPSSSAYLNINIALNNDFSKYVNAVHNISISWVNANNINNINNSAIDLNLSTEAQMSKLRNILSPYFEVHYSNEDDILTIVALNDKVLDINDITFTKSEKIYLVGIYEYVECKVKAKNSDKYRTIYKYSFPKQDTYVEILKSGNESFLTYAKSKYIELNDRECNTRIHDKIHECFYDNGQYYIRTRNYKYGMSIEGNVLNLYDMAKSHLYDYTYIQVADVVDIRNIYGAKDIDINENSDKPIDIKTRVLWVDYSSINKNGEYLVPAQTSEGSIDTTTSIISSDSWSYGQLMYNNIFDNDDPYFSTTHFQSKKLEDECICQLFGSVFKDISIKDDVDKNEYICRFVHYVMKCCYKDDEDKHPIALYFKQTTYPNSIYQRFLNDNDSYNFLKEGINNNDSINDVDSLMGELLTNVGFIIENEMHINNISQFLESYLSTCDEDVLNDINVYNTPKIYDGKSIMTLFGITYNIGLEYAAYKFKSIIVPCHRVAVKLTQSDKEYNSVFRIIKNEKAKQIILATFIDLPCIMPFSLWSENDKDYYTMFGSFKRSDFVNIYNGTIAYDNDAFDSEYIKEAESYNENITEDDDKITYKRSIASKIILKCIDYIDKDDFKNGIAKLFATSDGKTPAESSSTLNQVLYGITGNSDRSQQNTHFNLALIGYEELLGDDDTELYPSKIHIYRDNTQQYSLGNFFTLFNDFDILPPQIKNILSNINKSVKSIEYSSIQSYIKYQEDYIKCMIVPYSDVYNSYVRDLYNDDNGKLECGGHCIAVNVQQYEPNDKTIDSLISADKSAIRTKLKNADAYTFKNYICNIDENILKEYDVQLNQNYFISSNDSTDIKYAYCYPIRGQIFTYDIVDDCVTLQPYNLMRMRNSAIDNNYTGKLYKQFISIYNNNTNKIEHIVSLENIFDDNVLKVEWENKGDDYHLNYRSQRFKSLVVYDETWDNDEDKLVENVSSTNIITSSKSYITGNQWINYKINRSTVDVKTYPSILYGESLSSVLLSICNVMMSNENVENSKYIDEDECKGYADTFMFHLYDYYLKMHSIDDTDSFNILSFQPTSSQSYIINYSTKLCYEQSYNDIALKNIFFTFNMKLRK